MKRPLTGLVIVYAAGIGVGSRVDWPAPCVLACAAALLLLFLCWRRLPVLLVLVGCAGLLAVRETAVPSSPYDIARRIKRDQSAGLRGVIITAPEESATNRCSFKLALTALRRFDDWEPAEGRVWVSAAARPLRYGDEIECDAALRRPEPARNPGGFDGRAWLAAQHIAYIATIGREERCEVLAQDRGNPLTALALRVRARLERALRLGLEDEPHAAGVLVGMVIGKRSAIPADTNADFQRTGVFHVFAINGLHVGLVTAPGCAPERW